MKQTLLKGRSRARDQSEAPTIFFTVNSCTHLAAKNT
ncbi:MAG: hypothetical protein ACJA06_001228 [Halocynthiibacter sp.]|jgi:hypothetical protein